MSKKRAEAAKKPWVEPPLAPTGPRPSHQQIIWVIQRLVRAIEVRSSDKDKTALEIMEDGRACIHRMQFPRARAAK